jgi:transcriptional regulator with XRE-family HTH domain
MDKSDKLAFAARLKQAIKRNPKKISSPSELALQFNLRHRAAQITNQAAQKWLSGENYPSADRLVTLAEMLNVSAQWLRYGIPETMPERQPGAKANPVSQLPPTKEELQLLHRLRNLPEHQRALVADIIEQLALQQEMWRV